MTEDAKDERYWAWVDEFIDTANRLGREAQPGRVSSSLLFAAARHNAFLVASTARDRDDLVARKEEAVAHNMDNYRLMLARNLDEYIENFDDYIAKNRKQ